MTDEEKGRLNTEGDSQPGSQEVQKLQKEATTSKSASEPGSHPDSRTPPAKK